MEVTTALPRMSKMLTGEGNVWFHEEQQLRTFLWAVNRVLGQVGWRDAILGQLMVFRILIQTQTKRRTCVRHLMKCHGSGS